MKPAIFRFAAAILIAVVVLCHPSVGLAAGQPAASPETAKISPKEAYELHRAGKAYFIDARKESDYRQGHIPGAVNIEPGGVGAHLKNLAGIEGKTIIVHCYVGGMVSSTLAKELQSHGITRFRLLDGNWYAWTDAGYPTTGGDKGR